MTEYIVNPRRAPRAPSRCAALVHTPDADWNAETEDFSPLGCQLVAPGAMARGLPLKLVFASPKVQGSLIVEGKVAWGSSQPPWRVGVAFGDASRTQSEHWFAQLVAAYPGMAGLRRVPDRLPVDAMLFLAPPPTFLLDFTPGEVEVLRHVASGTTIASLRGRLAVNWNGSQRAIFSLLARGVLTISRSTAAHPATWKKAMAELEAEFVTEGPRAIRPPIVLERATERSPPPVKKKVSIDKVLELYADLGDESPASPPPPPPPPPPARTARPAATLASTPPPGAVGAGPSAGTGWRGDARVRSSEAQQCLDIGRIELAAGRSHSAMAHLRRAIQLAPGDQEIAAEIGRAMSRG